jgi:hypothetical protein
MSYSLNTPCYNCSKEKTCSDRIDIKVAIDTIHNTSKVNGHQGAGTVVLACVMQNKE